MKNKNEINHFQTNYDSLGQVGMKTTENFPRKTSLVVDVQVTPTLRVTRSQTAAIRQPVPHPFTRSRTKAYIRATPGLTADDKDLFPTLTEELIKTRGLGDAFRGIPSSPPSRLSPYRGR